MGGDSPLDYLGDLAEVCAVGHDFEADNTFHGYRFTREKLERAYERKAIQKSLRENEDPIYGQVVGATFLWAGAEMPEELKSRVVSDAKKDEWAAEGDNERRKFINDFIDKVEEHKGGKQVELADEGLFDKIAEAMGG